MFSFARSFSCQCTQKMTAFCGVSEVVVVHSACPNFHRTRFLMGAVCYVCSGRPCQQRTSLTNALRGFEVQKTMHYKLRVPRGVFPIRGCCGEEKTGGQMTTIMLASAHPCLRAVARAMCGSSFLALRCFLPCPFPSVPTCGEYHDWVVPPRIRRDTSASRRQHPSPRARELRQQDLVAL